MSRRWLPCLLCPLVLLPAVKTWGQAPPPDQPLLDFKDPKILTCITPGQPDQVSVALAAGAAGVVATCRPGKNAYPGIVVKPEAAVWDLSRFGHVQARVVNTGTVTSNICLRVDNEGDWTANPWSAEAVTLKPGETGTIHVRFGFFFGKTGFALNPAKVTQMLLFANKSDQEQTFRLESLIAGGAPGEKPPVDPNSIRFRPRDGVLLGPGGDPTALQPAAQGGARAEFVVADGQRALRVVLPAGNTGALALLKLAQGMWDLRDWLQVVVSVTNEGQTPVTPKARLDCNWQTGAWVVADTPLAPGGTAELTLPFAGGMAVIAGAGTPAAGGTLVQSDAVQAIAFAAEGEGEKTLRVASVRASVPPPSKLPEWLGRRPPVEGDWTQTLNENFEGPKLDETKWSIYYPNYWDKRAHFSKDNVILGDGLLRLRFEKKRGHAEDDPAKPETDWQTGFLTSIGKFRQRYGYFECRMKLPTAPGLWPAFWMMPDRGAGVASRESTADGGMEFDVMEYLVRYGPYRYNVAWHWDNYGKDHKSKGTDRIYFQPDQDGFVTSGLLWEPGKLTMYANGVPLAQWNDPRVASVPEYIIFTAVSGGWGGNDLTGEGLPDDFVLDYVRVWQRTEEAQLPIP